jgi:hypothetical protein
MSEDEEKYEDQIQRLIADVEKTKNNLNDIVFRGMIDIPYLLVALLILYVVLPPMTTMRSAENLSLLVSSIALITSASLYSFTVFPSWDRAFSNYKAGKMCKSSKYNKEPKKNEETRVLLTALIFMKVRRPKVKLSAVYRLEPETFTRKNLIQLVYG